MAPRRRAWLDAAPLRRARRRLQKGHGIGRHWKRPLPPPPPILETVTLSRAYTISGRPIGPGTVQVSPDTAADLRAAESQARLNAVVWAPRQMPPQSH